MTKPPTLTPLKSSMLAGYHHDPATGKLTVQFKDADGKPGAVWDHDDVGVDKVVTMTGAISPGRFFNDRIKGIHSGRKVG